MIRYGLRYILLAMAFAMTTYGLIAWHEIDYGLSPIWPFAGTPELHPLHLLALGVAMIPASLWEIFAIDHRGRKGV